MSREDFIIELFWRVEDKMGDVPQPSPSNLWPSEMVTRAFRLAIQGVGHRAFYPWWVRDWKKWLPHRPDRTRGFGRFKTPRDGTERFLADPTILGVLGAYGRQRIPPIREGRTPAPGGVEPSWDRRR